ncbi:MAG TPA: EAL domain-containing protein [Sumerlaeia bacterium]|nr:EAL domain-containing protein [Sumerlaeia bacterium]
MQTKNRSSGKTVSMVRLALQALGLVLVIPFLAIVYLLRHNMAENMWVLIFVLMASSLGYYLLWSALLRSVNTLLANLQKVSRGEAENLTVAEGSSQLQEVAEIVNALNRITKGLRGNAGEWGEIFRNIPVGTVLLDAETHQILDVNQATIEAFGAPREEIVGRICHEFICPTEEGSCPVTDRGLEVDHSECVLVTAGGEHRPILKTVRRVEIDGRDRLIESFMDISDHKTSEEEIQHRAYHDRLTDLPNGALFLDRLNRVIKRSRRHPEFGFALLFLDLDRFKSVNDAFGHLAGDEMLIAVAHRLESCVRAGDSVARLGGDEFTMLLDGVSSPAEAAQLADRANRRLAQPYRIRGCDVRTGASVGIAMSGPDMGTAEEMLRRADAAMYRAKALGRGRHVLYDQAMHERAVVRDQIEEDLRKATEAGEFRTFYHPLVSLKSGRIVGFSALARWLHPKRGVVLPGEFIPIAEEIGLVTRIDEWILRDACRQAVQWQQRFPGQPPLSISANFSASQLLRRDLVDQVRETLSETTLDPSCLHLEVREGVLMENATVVADTLGKLKAMNVWIQVDNFGTGFSSLRYLQRFPIDGLKIDFSFVQAIGEDPESLEMVRTILNLAHNLGAAVTAEGVESAEQLRLLRELGCEFGQGFFFSPPLPAADAEALLAEGKRW